MNEVQEPSGLYKTFSTLGKAVAIGATILGTPALFEATRRPLFTYLARSWGGDIAGLLVWVMGAIEAYVIYVSVSLLVTAGLTWLVTAAAMRQFKD